MTTNKHVLTAHGLAVSVVDEKSHALVQSIVANFPALASAGVVAAIDSVKLENIAPDMPLVRASATYERKAKGNPVYHAMVTEGREIPDNIKPFLVDPIITGRVTIDAPKINKLQIDFTIAATSTVALASNIRIMYEGYVGTLYLEDAKTILDTLIGKGLLSNPSTKSVIDAATAAI